MRLILCCTPPDADPSTEMLAVSMVKASMLEAAFINTFAIWVLLGTEADAKRRSISLMIDPLRNEVTVRSRNEENDCL